MLVVYIGVKMSNVLLSYLSLGELQGDGTIIITDEKTVKILEQNEKDLTDMGFALLDSYGVSGKVEYYCLKPIYNKKNELDIPLEERIRKLEFKIEELCKKLGKDITILNYKPRNIIEENYIE